MKCKISNKPISPFMNFGKMPIANGFLRENQFQEEFFYKMEVGFSEKLSLFQLNEFPKPEKMFNQNYPFFTGSSKFMVQHFAEYALWVKKNYLKENSKLIEIGSNDGTFLSNFKNTNINFLGFEPSANVAKRAPTAEHSTKLAIPIKNNPVIRKKIRNGITPALSNLIFSKVEIFLSFLGKGGPSSG